MATRSRIGILNEDRMMVESIYCHWDGYLTGVGKTLFDNWFDVDKVRTLIKGGDCSSVGHDMTDTVFYARDRGDFGVDPKVHSVIRWVDSGHDYEYLFTPSLGTWSYRSSSEDPRGPWTLLSEALGVAPRAQASRRVTTAPEFDALVIKTVAASLADVSSAWGFPVTVEGHQVIIQTMDGGTEGRRITLTLTSDDDR